MSNTKICSKCGKENDLDAKFCRICGNNLEVVERKNDRKLVPISTVIIAIVSLALVSCIIIVKSELVKGLYNKNSQELIESEPVLNDDISGIDEEYSDQDDRRDLFDVPQEITSEEEITSDEVGQNSRMQDEGLGVYNELDDKKNNVEESISETAYDEPTGIDLKFGIDTKVITNYADALEPEKYGYYDSDISDFYFSYAKQLYNKADYDDAEEITDYGMRLQNIVFSGTDGSELCYRLYNRTDGLCYDDLTEIIHDKEKLTLEKPQDIYVSTKKGYGIIIVTGYREDIAIYDLVKIEDNYIMQMIVSFPEPSNTNDKNHKWYVTDCYYRMCGFSESSNGYRSYIEYLRDNLNE